MSEDRLTIHAERRLGKQTAKIVQYLRDLADEIERDGQRAQNPIQLAYTVQGKLAWGFANLNADMLTRIAAEWVEYRHLEQDAALLPEAPNG